MKNKLVTNISFLNLAAQSPTIELNLSLSEKVHIGSNRSKHIFFMCNKALKSCSLNLFNKKSICNICTYKAKKGFEVFKKRNPNCELIKVNRNDLLNIKIKNNDLVSDEILLGVNSTIGSQLRLDDLTILNPTWTKIKSNMLDSAFGLYNYFDDYFKNNNIENFIIFNGRISCARPLKVAASKNNINYILFDARLNGLTPYYSTNEMFHSISFEKRNALKTYLKFFKDSRSIAEQYAWKKQNKLSILRDKVFTKNQKLGYVDESVIKFKKPIISIYVSSDDEYRFLGNDFGRQPIIDQIESIDTLINSQLNNIYDIVVKMHPNQNNSHKSILAKYKNLSKKVKILFPNDKTDSYQLIKMSKIVICFSSSIGTEANYLRKPVIQIGPSKWMGLPTANFMSDANSAIELILSKKYKLMPQRSSIIYFTFNMKAFFELQEYKYIEDGIYSYANHIFKVPIRLRLMAIISKIRQALLRGDKKIIKNIYLYIPNLIFGTTKTN